jgi:hypothetical protein
VKFLDSATVKQAYVLSPDPLTFPETYDALTPATVLEVCDKQLIAQSCYFLRQNTTCLITPEQHVLRRLEEV